METETRYVVRGKKESPQSKGLNFSSMDLDSIKQGIDIERAMSAMMDIDLGMYNKMVEPKGYLIRADLAGAFKKGDSIETFPTGYLLDSIETEIIGKNKASSLSSEWLLGFIAATRGFKVQPSFVVKDTYDMRIARRLWTGEDVKNVLDFVDFLRHYTLAAETAATMLRQEPILRGLLAYSIWLDASRRGDWHLAKTTTPNGSRKKATDTTISDV